MEPKKKSDSSLSFLMVVMVMMIILPKCCGAIYMDYYKNSECNGSMNRCFFADIETEFFMDSSHIGGLLAATAQAGGSDPPQFYTPTALQSKKTKTCGPGQPYGSCVPP